MPKVHQLSRRDARRMAVRAQLLDKPRPTDLMETVKGLSLLNIDPVSAVAPSADLVVWSRLGSAYDPKELQDAAAELRLIELQGTLRPAEDLVLYRAEMETWPGTGELRDYQEYMRDWVRTNDACRRDILARLRMDGPLPSRELPDTCVRPWESTGWTNNKNVAKLLDYMVARGEVAVAGRRGRDRLWDLASRVYPDEPAPGIEEARRLRDERRLRALGIARSRGPHCNAEPLDVGQAGEPAVIDGVRGEWRVDPAQLGQPFTGRAALVCPFDRMLHDRKRVNEIFEFEYYLEMYKPADNRRWGYYALPILYGDRLVGKLDATADRRAGVLDVHALHRDVPFSKAMTTAVDREIKDLARWLDLELSLEVSQN